MEKKLAIGVDIGGTSIKGGAVTSDGKVLDVFSLPVDKSLNQEQTINALIEVINKYLKEHNYNKDNVLGIGLGVPGCIDSLNGVVTYSNNLQWYELPISKMIGEGTGLPVRITNDANAATLGEAKFGAGKKYKNLLMFTLGTGVGGGIIINGKLYEGHMGKGAELGHTIVVMDGEPCTCGRKGCFETYASATALVRETKKMMEEHQDSKLHEIVKRLGKLDARAAFIADREGDKYGHILVENYVRYLSEGLMNFFNIFRPEAICLSGGVANEREYLISRVVKYCEERDYGYKGTPKVDIITSELGYDSGKIGAASLFFEDRVENRLSKRLGAAKKELEGCDTSLETLNSIPVEGFNEE